MTEPQLRAALRRANDCIARQAEHIALLKLCAEKADELARQVMAQKEELRLLYEANVQELRGIVALLRERVELRRQSLGAGRN